VETNLSLVVPAINRILKSIDDLALCLDAKGFDFSKAVIKKRKIVLKKADKVFLILNLLLLAVSIVLRVIGYGFVPMY
jgi:energy-coupling factor transporter transmembrane protein EcfT